MRYLDLDIKEINSLLKEKKIKPIDLVNEAFERIEKSNLNCFITLNKEDAINWIQAVVKEANALIYKYLPFLPTTLLLQ